MQNRGSSRTRVLYIGTMFTWEIHKFRETDGYLGFFMLICIEKY